MTQAIVKNVNGQLFVDLNDGSGGRAQVADNEPMRATYGYSVLGYAISPANPTDLITISNPVGSGKIVKVRQIVISALASSTITLGLQILRRLSLNSGGTSTTPTLNTFDTANDAAVSVLNFYTVNPTLNDATTRALDGGRLIATSGSGNNLDREFWQFGWLNDQPPIIRPGELVALNFGGTSIQSGASLDVSLRVSEEPFPVRI